MSRGAAQAAVDDRSGRPGTPWLLLILLLAGLAASLALHHLLAPARPVRVLGPAVFDPASDVGPVMDLSGAEVRSAPGDQAGIGVALVDVGAAIPVETVDDVLARHGVVATWFLSGRTLRVHSDAGVSARSAGGEVGVTGFSGADLAGLPAWRARVELSTSQAVLAAQRGVTSSLLMLPNAPRTADLDAAAFRAAATAAEQGYRLVAGVEPEVAGPGQVAVVPLDRHAGPRLDALLTRIEQQGLEPMTVSRLAGLSDPANRPVGWWARANGWAVLLAASAADLVATAVQWMFWPVTVLLGLRAVVAVVLAVIQSRRRAVRGWRGPVTVIVPVYNEAAGIEATLLSLVGSRWPAGVTVIVVDDGSTDGTGAIVEHLALPDVWLIRQPNAGKPAALNAALAAVRTEVVVLVDGDTVFEPETIGRLVAPFSDPNVGAASGNAKVVNRGSLLGRWQHIEYVMGFNLDRRLLALCRAIPTVPGAVGAYRTRVLREVGGVSSDTMAEDTDLTIAVTRAGWRVVYQDQARAWTEAPATTGDLWRQRYRWSYGTLQAAWKHRRALRERRAIGLVGLPYAWLFQVMLPLLGPVSDVVALYSLATGGLTAVLWAWLAFTGVQLVLAGVAFRLDGERLRDLWALPLQQLFYRQLMYLVVVQSVTTAVTGNRLRWHKLRRTGATTAALAR